MRLSRKRPLAFAVLVAAAALAAVLLGAASGGPHYRQTSARVAAQTSPIPHMRDCFADPGACGYPDPSANNVGAQTPCAKLRHSGVHVLSRPGQVLRNVSLTGKLYIVAPNVTVDNVCIVADGYAQLGSQAVEIDGRASHTLIEHTTIRGVDAGPNSIEIAAENDSGAPATLEHVNVSDCGECVHGGPWVIRDSYMISNGMRGTSDHYEDVYCDNTSVRLYHDTAFDPQNQVAEVFCDTNNGNGGSCSDHVTILDSLLAGGGFLMYACGNADSPGTSTLDVQNNVFARCRTMPIRFNSQSGGYACAGTLSDAAGAGADKHGYWPRGGYYGVASDTYCGSGSGNNSVWSDNVWDDNHEPVRC
jgi:hypothetical protein